MHHLSGGAGALRAHGNAGFAIGKDRPVIVVGDVFALLKLDILFDRDEGLRHPADGDHRRAIGVDLRRDKLLGAVGQRDHHDDRSHADDDPEQREDAAHLVGPQRLQREFEGLFEGHGFPLL